ncbi:MAG: ISL3 family transposase [Acidobacteriota bacterium]|nr:ISL3 family transposase [Acidobacteriota bacterium]
MFQSTELFTTAIGLTNPWYVKKIQFDIDKKRLDLYVDFEKGSKFKYKRKDQGNQVGKKFKVHDTREKVWRHLNFFEHECYLHCRVPRVKLDNGKVKIVNPPFAGLSNGFTLLFEALALQLCKGMTVAEASRMMRESEHKLWEMIDRYIRAGRDIESYEDVRTLGVDETSKAKGHDYISLFADLEERKVIFITKGKDHKTVKRFVTDFKKHNGNEENLEEVCCDLSPAFIKGITENIPGAEITFDKFHVLKIINTAVDQVRREESKTQSILKYSRYVVLKNRANLTKKQVSKLEELQLSKLNLKTMRAMRIRESFQYIYEAETKDEFEILLKKWYYWATHSRIAAIIKVAKSVRAHQAGILRWYESRISNGALEGINSTVQLAKSKARGYRTFRNFKNIIYLLKGDLNFSFVNSSYPLFFT